MCLDTDCNAEDVTRRGFFVEAVGVAIGVGVATANLVAEQKDQPPTRVLDDPNVEHGKVTFRHGGKETFDGFLARPKREGQFPAVLVIAGNRITEEYIPNTCAALAIAGFVGLAPNVFHPLPEIARTREEMNTALKDHTDFDVLQDVQVGADYLKMQPFVKPGGIGVLGFCFGGRIALLFGARSREVDAVVPFHPGTTTPAEIARLKGPGPVQVHSGKADKQVAVTAIAELERVLQAQKTPVEVFLYDDADHGFLAYTRPTYKAEAAKLAWERTTAFLARQLK